MPLSSGKKRLFHTDRKGMLLRRPIVYIKVALSNSKYVLRGDPSMVALAYIRCVSPLVSVL